MSFKFASTEPAQCESVFNTLIPRLSVSISSVSVLPGTDAVPVVPFDSIVMACGKFVSEGTTYSYAYELYDDIYTRYASVLRLHSSDVGLLMHESIIGRVRELLVQFSDFVAQTQPYPLLNIKDGSVLEGPIAAECRMFGPGGSLLDVMLHLSALCYFHLLLHVKGFDDEHAYAEIKSLCSDDGSKLLVASRIPASVCEALVGYANIASLLHVSSNLRAQLFERESYNFYESAFHAFLRIVLWFTCRTLQHKPTLSDMPMLLRQSIMMLQDRVDSCPEYGKHAINLLGALYPRSDLGHLNTSIRNLVSNIAKIWRVWK